MGCPDVSQHVKCGIERPAPKDASLPLLGPCLGESLEASCCVAADYRYMQKHGT